MKTVLVILSQANLSHLNVSESLSATMVLATFGCQVKVLVKNQALTLLYNSTTFDRVKHAYKLASNMVESFEFYDLLPLLIDEKDRESPYVKACTYDIEFVRFNPTLLDQFDHVLYW